MGGTFSFLVSIFCCFSIHASYDVEGGKGLNFAKLQNLVADNHMTSVDQVLVGLKNQYPSLFQNYVMMYRSRSIQPASLVFPRVLLVGPDAKIILAFNGDPKHPSYHVLEIMEFMEASNRFEFREIRFSSGEMPAFSKANPSKCLACHQSQNRKDVDPRPNWEPYSIWPGAYGSNGSITSSRIKYDDRIREEDHQFAEDHMKEPENYNYFKTYIKPHNNRYRLLGPIDFNFTVKLTESLLTLNYRRVIRLAQQTPFYKSYKYAFAAGAKCGHIPWDSRFEGQHTQGLVRPEKLRKEKSPQYVYQNISLDEVNVFQTGERSGYVPEKVEPPLYPKRRLSEAIALIFEPLGIDTTDWSTDFRTEGGRFAFRERFGIPSNPLRQMTNQMKSLDPELMSNSCKELEAKSLQALGDFADQRDGLTLASEALQKSLKRRDRPAAQLCARCHSDPDDPLVPEIFFDEPQSLKDFAQSNRFPRGSFLKEVEYRTGSHAVAEDQMPPRKSLTGPQRAELLEFIQKSIE